MEKTRSTRARVLLTPEQAVGCGWVVGRKLQGTAQSRDSTREEQGAGRFAAAVLCVMWV